MKEGKKFFLDMTDAAGGGGEAYLGIDFGTSNTAVCYVDKSWVQVIESRNKDSQWKELGELVDLLPSPLAVPLAHYIGDRQSNSVVPPGYSFIDAALCLLAYVTLAEYYCTSRRAVSRIFKQYSHRSATARWLLLRSTHDQLGKSSGSDGTAQSPFYPAKRGAAEPNHQELGTGEAGRLTRKQNVEGRSSDVRLRRYIKRSLQRDLFKISIWVYGIDSTRAIFKEICGEI